MTIEIEDEPAKSGGRVWAAWAVLAVATMIHAAGAAWLAWRGWLAANMTLALGGLLHAPPPPAPGFAETLAAAGALAASSFVVGLVVAALQRRVLVWRLRFVLSGWVLRSAAAAAAITATWGIVVPTWNRASGVPSEGIAIAQVIACVIGEGLAMFAVQRGLLEATARTWRGS